jgi:hypothetical protein
VKRVLNVQGMEIAVTKRMAVSPTIIDVLAKTFIPEINTTKCCRLNLSKLGQTF